MEKQLWEYLQPSDYLDHSQSGLTPGYVTEIVLVELVNNLLVGGGDVCMLLLYFSNDLDIVANEVL